MANCVSLIEAPISLADMSQWTLVSDMTGVIETKELENIQLLSNNITADKLTFDGIDCTQIGAIVLHECTDNELDEIMQYQSPPEGLVQNGDDVCLVICGFCIVDDCCDIPDRETFCDEQACMSPCERWIKLRCCLDDLICGVQVATVEYEDRRITYTRANIDCLKQEINKAYIECNQSQCIRTPRRFLFTC